MKSQLMNGERWEYMRETIAGDLANADRLARSITQGYMPEVYSQNFAYGTYDLERQSGIDTSFTLYSRESMEFLFRENPQILPNPGKKVSKAIAEGKAMRWNKQHVQSVMMQAILQGNSIPDIATRLSNAVCDTNRKAAIRNARTMANGVQNAGRIDSYKRGEEMGIKNEKQWVATLDMRTRHEHRLLDGVKIPLDEKFVVEGEEIRYPCDPTASPHMVWNCRCTIISKVKGWQSMAEAHRSSQKLEEEELDYDSWKESRKEIHKPIDDPEKKREAIRAQFIRGYRGYGGPVAEGMNRALDIDFKNWKPKPEPPKEPTFKDKIDAIRNRIAQNGGTITEADLQEAGRLLAADRDAYKKPEKDRLDEAQRKFDEWANASGFKKYDKIVDSDDDTAYTNEEIREAWHKISEFSRTKEYKEVSDPLEEAAKAYYGTMDGNSKWLREKLSEIREMGGADLDMDGHMNGEESVKDIISWAYNIYPKSWVEKSIDTSNLTVGIAPRGYYSHPKSELMLSDSGFGEGSKYTAAVHELGHRFEQVIDGILDAEKTFYDRRTAGEQLEPLGFGFNPDEKTRKDNFIKEYMGKDYGGRGYELVSMGFQYIYTQPHLFETDQDMASWLYGILCLL